MRETFEELLAGHADGEALARLVRYAELIERWSARHNLVSYSGRRELVERHIADALAAAPLLGDDELLLDVGSGAGLPGVPLLTVGHRARGVLLEPRQKRWAFLRTVVRELALEAEVVCSRYQELSPGDQWTTVTARAVGDHKALLAWARSRLVEGGRVMLWTTEEGEALVREVKGWRVLSSALPGLDRGRLVRLQSCFT